MLKWLLRPLLHSSFLLTRPLTIGVRGICYQADTNSVLLVKHTYSEGWQLPGGGVESGESAFSTLRRELNDEVGIECRSSQVLDIYHNHSISKRDHVVIYLVEVWQEQPAHKHPKLEIAEANWFRLDDLPTELTPCSEYALRALPADKGGECLALVDPAKQSCGALTSTG
jgi:8-oxo-dGTP pyrophosphatase MutT (NUDIX family)